MGPKLRYACGDLPVLYIAFAVLLFCSGDNDAMSVSLLSALSAVLGADDAGEQGFVRLLVLVVHDHAFVVCSSAGHGCI